MTISESPDPNLDGNPMDALDTDQDGIPNYLDDDDDGDGIPTQSELDSNGQGVDSDGDGIFNHLDVDDDNDMILTINEINSDAQINADLFLDTDGDQIPNHLDVDDDGDQELSIDERVDTDLDGILDALESNLLDCDNDGVNDEHDEENCNPYNDSDRDGITNLDEINAGLDPNNPNDTISDFSVFDFEITNFLSPNGDGINDYWYDPALERYPNNEVWIISRSGSLIYHKINYRNDWDGSRNGETLPEGAYYYQIDFNRDGSIDYSGWLYLTR